MTISSPSVSPAHTTLNATLRTAVTEAAAAEMIKSYKTDLSWEEHTGEPMVENADEAITSNGFEEGFEAALVQRGEDAAGFPPFYLYRNPQGNPPELEQWLLDCYFQEELLPPVPPSLNPTISEMVRGW